LSRQQHISFVLVAIGLFAAASVHAYTPPEGESCPASPPVNYFVASQVDLTSLLAPPPGADSSAQKQDLQAVIAAQRLARANGTMERAIDDSEMNCARFKDVLGPELKSTAAASALEFVTRAASSIGSAANPAKRYWKRPRPWMMSPEVKPMGDAADAQMAYTEYPEKHCVDAPPKAEAEAKKLKSRKDKDLFERNTTSYPSGHSAFGMACGILLAQIVPEKRAELFARAYQYGESRVILGAHFPSDVAAGQQIALAGATLVMENGSFERQFVDARNSIRAALKYPVAMPDLEPRKDLFK
jgi:acid phosphatase (class A)